MKRSEIKQMKKRKKWPWIVLLLVFVSFGAYALSFYTELSSTLKNMHSPIDREESDKRANEIELENQHPFSVLVLGVDEREGDKGRSDTMIVLTVNPKLKSTKMVSIPRDTYTEIVGYGKKDKLNHAFAFGGIEMSLASVENLLDMPIDYVAEINMEGFQDIVDAVGGIKVENAFDFTQDSIHFPAGTITLNGKEALSYIRMRKGDPNGDFGRQERQKQVIQGVLHKGASFNNLLKYRGIFNALGDNVKTNMTFDEMMEVQKSYRAAAGTIDQLHFEKGHGQRMNGRIWYYIMDEAELNQMSDELKQHLELN
ncbi:LCP family protein [Sporosarcina sp. HYO08]|uniref:LCP family glycopolymer transferase n=1 Tax=Sporosarcina sp. HYO08 TaxID=1759557 RepID=UPI00079B3BFB|nr:LCP family protein [Sporosarcina sp. HYO08]KXH81919.1 trascriptional regulator [Sporosarcina sp. HYO08]